MSGGLPNRGDNRYAIPGVSDGLVEAILAARKIVGRGFKLKNGASKEKLELLADRFDERIKQLMKSGELIVRVADYDYRRKTSQYDPNEIYHVNETTLRISLGGRTAVPVMVYGVSSQIEKNISVYERLIGDELIQDSVITR